MKTLFLAFIRFYRWFPLETFGVTRWSCRFTPTCSEYCYRKIAERGTIVGLWQCAVRILRCNPLLS